MIYTEEECKFSDLLELETGVNRILYCTDNTVYSV